MEQFWHIIYDTVILKPELATVTSIVTNSRVAGGYFTVSTCVMFQTNITMGGVPYKSAKEGGGRYSTECLHI